MRLERHEQGEIIEPPLLFLAKAREVFRPRIFLELPVRVFKQSALEPDHGRIVHVPLVKVGQRLRMMLAEKTLLEKELGAEKKGITRKCRVAVIRRVEVLEIRRVQRKALPEPLFRLGQEVGKPEGPWSHIADPKPRG